MGSKVGFEVYLLVFYAKFLPDFVPVSIDCTYDQIKKLRYLFCGFTLPDKICYLNFHGSELQIYFGKFAHQRHNNLIPRKATNCGFSLAINTNSCVAQACNSLLLRVFAPCSLLTEKNAICNLPRYIQI